MVLEAVDLYGNPLGAPEKIKLELAESDIHLGVGEAARSYQLEESLLGRRTGHNESLARTDQLPEPTHSTAPATRPHQLVQLRATRELSPLSYCDRSLHLPAPEPPGHIEQGSRRRSDRHTHDARDVLSGQ
jgi:hypothetical protein